MIACPTGEFVSEAVWIETAAVSFNRDDFTENLVGYNRFSEVEGGITAEDKKVRRTQRCVLRGLMGRIRRSGLRFSGAESFEKCRIWVGLIVCQDTHDAMGDKLPVGTVKNDIAFMDGERLDRRHHHSFIVHNRRKHAVARR